MKHEVFLTALDDYLLRYLCLQLEWGLNGRNPEHLQLVIVELDRRGWVRAPIQCGVGWVQRIGPNVK